MANYLKDLDKSEVIPIKSKDLRILIANLIKNLSLQKSFRKRKNLKRDFWINFIKENYETIKLIKQQRKLYSFYETIKNSDAYKSFPISYDYFSKLVREVLK